ncbi:hypothetical protein PFTANZ_05828, partial [Plasmodium falciparum Tanzania (2000708)]
IYIYIYLYIYIYIFVLTFLFIMPSLKDEVSFENRVAETHKIRSKYPNRIPVVCERANRSNLPIIEKKKFLVPMNMLVGEFKFILHQHINQSAYGSNMKLFRERTIYLFVNNIVPKTGLLMQDLYEMYKDEDGYLYMEYSCESCLG